MNIFTSTAIIISRTELKGITGGGTALHQRACLDPGKPCLPEILSCPGIDCQCRRASMAPHRCQHI